MWQIVAVITNTPSDVAKMVFLGRPPSGTLARASRDTARAPFAVAVQSPLIGDWHAPGRHEHRDRSGRTPADFL